MSKPRRKSRSVSDKPAVAVALKDPPRPAPGFRDLWIYLVLFVATFAVYSQVRQFSFIDYDDPDYVDAAQVREGMTWEGVKWAFTSGEASNWFPLTRLSHMLDRQLFGWRPGLQHLNNVLIHALATLLVFAFLRRATGARWRSALVAFLFALHPLHVESVAWVAERKDVLSAFFWFLTLWLYVRYSDRPNLGRYGLVLLCFCLGLMSKPMIVTLPVVLLLVDIWPLRRLAIPGLLSNDPRPHAVPILWKRAIWEKIPFLLLSAGVSVIAYVAQKSAGAVEQLNVHPLGVRIENALVSYVVYVAKMFWPSNLAMLYPYPTNLPVWQVVLAGLAIVGASVLVLRSIRGYPYLAAGWFWYLGTLVPVIGIVQVGLQARADRYTYIPMVGLSIMLAWGASDVVRRWPRAKPAVVSVFAAACLAAVMITVAQLQFWKNSETVYRHALAVTDGNFMLHYGLGFSLARSGDRWPEAISEYRTAIRLSPDYAPAHFLLGEALSKNPDTVPEAITEYEIALKLKPNSSEGHNNLGAILSRIPGRLPQAASEWEAAVRIKPGFMEAHYNLGDGLSKLPGRLPEAIAHYEAALRLKPNFAEAHNNLGVALSRIPDRMPQAISEYQAALRIKPGFVEAHYNLADAYAKTPGRLAEAIPEYEAALRIKPDSFEAHANLGLAFSKTPGKTSEAISELEAALRIRSDTDVRQLLDQLRTGSTKRN